MASRCAACAYARLIVSVGLSASFALLSALSVTSGHVPPLWLLVALGVSVCGAVWVVTDQTRHRKERANDGVR